MEWSDEAGVVAFPIGPTTALGRMVAQRVLLCRWAIRALQELRRRAAERLHRWRRAAAAALTWLGRRRASVMLAAAALAALAVRRRRRAEPRRAERTFRRHFWANMMKSALTYEEWAHAASMLDKEEEEDSNPSSSSSSSSDRRRRKDADLYDEELVRGKLAELKLRRLEGGLEDIIFCLRADLVRNLGNMCNPELHKGRMQTPKLIQEYINEVRFHLRAVCDTTVSDSSSSNSSSDVPLEERVAFIHETRHAFGRTALLLSGGAALGAFHLGVVRTLIEHRLLPRVVAGASVGSILCSFAATRTWPELQSFFDDPSPPLHFFDSMGSIFATAHRLLTRGAVQEIGLLQRKMRQLIGDLTFQEAYELSGRVLGISVCSPRRHEPPRCLNYLTSPHVVIWSAVTASCAFPGLFEAQELMAKDRHGRLVPYHTLSQAGPAGGAAALPGGAASSGSGRQWRDGSLESDLPMMQLKELFNVNHFIVSQANPHIAPLLRLKELVRAVGGDFAAKLAHLAEMEVKHRCNQVLEMGYRLFGLAKLFAQDWEGDITIVMPATFAQFAKLIQNPTPSELRKAVMQGRRCTWAKLSAIQANCGIELMLDECMAELNRRRRAQREAERAALTTAAAANNANNTAARFSSAAYKRIPSWNCLARESSWGSLSLDEDSGSSLVDASGAAAAAVTAVMASSSSGGIGGPWGGPTSLRRFKAAAAVLGQQHAGSVDAGSDSDSGSGTEQELLWARAGGPLVRTASAAKLLLDSPLLADPLLPSPSRDQQQQQQRDQLQQQRDQQQQQRLERANSWDAHHQHKRGAGAANKINHDAFSFSLLLPGGGMRKSASASLVGGGSDAHPQLQQQYDDESSKQQHEDSPAIHKQQRQQRGLDKGAFGSFIVKCEDQQQQQQQQEAL